MTAPTSPGVVPADVRELVDRLRRRNERYQGSEGSPQIYIGSDAILDCEAADMLERLANRPSLTEDDHARRREHDRNIRVSECRLAVEFLHEFAREMNDPNAKAILNLAADNWGRARSRALADRSEPRQEMEGGRG